MDSAAAALLQRGGVVAWKGRTDPVREMIPLEEARVLVCGAVEKLPVETVELLDAVGRVVAADQTSDIDVSPFAHSAMDGFALRAAEIADAAEESPAMLRVIAEIGAGDVFEETIGEGECVRIMTGACLPADADAVVKYEIVGVVEGDGKPGSVVSFSAPTKVGSNIRAAGEEAHAGDVVVEAGDVLGYVSEPTKYYSVEGSNLYFALRHGEETIDPITFFE